MTSYFLVECDYPSAEFVVGYWRKPARAREDILGFEGSIPNYANGQNRLCKQGYARARGRVHIIGVQGITPAIQPPWLTRKRIAVLVNHKRQPRGPKILQPVLVNLGMKLPAAVLSKRRLLYTTEELARQLDVSRNTIGKLEKDPLSVQGRTLRAYLLALGWRLRVARDFHFHSVHRSR